jgi:hypothetical protein
MTATSTNYLIIQKILKKATVGIIHIHYGMSGRGGKSTTVMNDIA